GTPAETVGVAAGDLIVSIDGAATDGSSALIAAIRDKQPGDQVTVAIVRDSRSVELDVTLTARPG
ncbi:MAG: PDZ domain-containing protein, partial [Ilumatobacter sp.]